jgi:hypothetical protein
MLELQWQLIHIEATYSNFFLLMLQELSHDDLLYFNYIRQRKGRNMENFFISRRRNSMTLVSLVLGCLMYNRREFLSWSALYLYSDLSKSRVWLILLIIP